jgi:hypothetical protein
VFRLLLLRRCLFGGTKGLYMCDVLLLTVLLLAQECISGGDYLLQAFGVGRAAVLQCCQPQMRGLPLSGVQIMLLIDCWELDEQQCYRVVGLVARAAAQIMLLTVWRRCFCTILSSTQQVAAAAAAAVVVLLQRSTRIEVQYQDLDGKAQQMHLRDFVARVFQHEYDHLQVRAVRESFFWQCDASSMMARRSRCS